MSIITHENRDRQQQQQQDIANHHPIQKHTGSFIIPLPEVDDSHQPLSLPVVEDDMIVLPPTPVLEENSNSLRLIFDEKEAVEEGSMPCVDGSAYSDRILAATNAKTGDTDNLSTE